MNGLLIRVCNSNELILLLSAFFGKKSEVWRDLRYKFVAGLDSIPLDCGRLFVFFERNSFLRFFLETIRFFFFRTILCFNLKAEDVILFINSHLFKCFLD